MFNLLALLQIGRIDYANMSAEKSDVLSAARLVTIVRKSIIPVQILILAYVDSVRRSSLMSAIRSSQLV